MSYNNILVSIDGGSYRSTSFNLIEPIIQKTNPIYVNQSGDNMTGNLDMKNNKIINLPLPTEPKDCINKEYVDNRLNNIPRSYGFWLDIGSSDKNYKVTNHSIDIPSITPIMSNAINMQLTTLLFNDKYNDDINMSIKNYVITNNNIKLNILSSRINDGKPWEVHVWGYLLITVFNKPMPKA